MSDGITQVWKDAREQEEMDQRSEQRRKSKTMRKVTITEEEFDKAADKVAAPMRAQQVFVLSKMKEELFPPAPQWIFGREPTEEDADSCGDVAIPCFNETRLWDDRHYDLMPIGVPFMKLPDAQVYTPDNPAPNPFESNSQKQKQ